MGLFGFERRNPKIHRPPQERAAQPEPAAAKPSAAQLVAQGKRYYEAGDRAKA